MGTLLELNGTLLELNVTLLELDGALLELNVALLENNRTRSACVVLPLVCFGSVFCFVSCFTSWAWTEISM